MINIVIFSKNRAAQLELLLDSLKKYFLEFDKSDITVLCKFTNEKFEQGYSELKKECSFKGLSNIVFMDDDQYGSLRPTLITLLSSKGSNEYTMFLVDDIVFRDYFSLSDDVFSHLSSPEMLAVSLRLYDKIDHCYATNTPSKVPTFTLGSVWKWSGSEGDWGYPMSVDGNVFKTSLINNMLNGIVPMFYNPNMFEAVLNHDFVKPHLPKYMCCYKEKSKLINNPANRVQDNFQNRTTGAFTAEEINESFLSGGRLRPKIDLENLENNTVHYDIEMEIVNADNS